MKLLRRSLRARDPEQRLAQREEKNERKELLKLWKMKFFSPKISNEAPPGGKWFDVRRIKALAKVFEKVSNTTRLTVKLEPKDQEEYTRFKLEYQYYNVGLKVQKVPARGQRAAAYAC